jgi:hypothetical protein
MLLKLREPRNMKFYKHFVFFKVTEADAETI